MASKKSKSQAKPGTEAKTGRRATKKGSFRDLEAKDDQRIRGGKWSRENGSVSSSTSGS